MELKSKEYYYRFFKTSLLKIFLIILPVCFVGFFFAGNVEFLFIFVPFAGGLLCTIIDVMRYKLLTKNGRLEFTKLKKGVQLAILNEETNTTVFAIIFVLLIVLSGAKIVHRQKNVEIPNQKVKEVHKN